MKRILIAALLILSPIAPGIAGPDDVWRVRNAVGDVSVTTGDDLRMAATPRLALAEGTRVATGANARAVLYRGQEQITLQPLSQLVLTRTSPSETKVLQATGTALYTIGKKAAPHFQVDTPTLTAVVKGTSFSVAVNRTRSDVSVTEGAVQVATLAGSAVTLIRSGMSATVSAAATSEISLFERNGAQRIVTANEGGWSNSAALLRTRTSATPEATGTNLARLRDNTIGIQVTSTRDHEALRLNGGNTMGNGVATPENAANTGGLRQAATDDLFGSSATTSRPRLRGMGNVAQDAANAVAGKVDATMRTISRNKPLKVTATVPWTEMYMGLFGIMGLLVMSHIRTLRIRTKQLEGRS